MNDTNVAVIRLMALCDEYSKKGGKVMTLEDYVKVKIMVQRWIRRNKGEEE